MALLVDVSQGSGPDTGLVVDDLGNLLSTVGHADPGDGPTQPANIARVIVGSLVDAAESAVTADDEPLLDIDSAKGGRAHVASGSHGEK